jgi:protein Mpv17
MMTLGDIISQQAIEKRGFDNHDVGRSFRIYCYAFALGGPVMGTWFAFINRTITIKNNLAGKQSIYTHKKIQ